MSDAMLSPREIARRLDVTPGAVTYWVREGLLPGVKISRKVVRVKESDLREFLAARGRQMAA